MGHSLCATGGEEVQVGPDAMSRWFEGIELPFSEAPPVVVLPDYPSVLDDRHRSAVELGRSAAFGEIHWYSEGSRPADLRVCPTHLIAKEDEVKVVRDWSNVLTH